MDPKIPPKKDEKDEKSEEPKLAEEAFATLPDEVDTFEPVLGEYIADDAFAFTLLSCHCSGGSIV